MKIRYGSDSIRRIINKRRLKKLDKELRRTNERLFYVAPEKIKELNERLKLENNSQAKGFKMDMRSAYQCKDLNWTDYHFMSKILGENPTAKRHNKQPLYIRIVIWKKMINVPKIFGKKRSNKGMKRFFRRNLGRI